MRESTVSGILKFGATLRGGISLTTRPLYSLEKIPLYHRMRNLLGSAKGLDALEERITSCVRSEEKHYPRSYSLKPGNYVDKAVHAP